MVGLVTANTPPSFGPQGPLPKTKPLPPVTNDTVYDVALGTKTIPTSSLALRLWQDGLLDWDERVIEFVPTLQGEFADQVTIRDLMEQTVYFPQSLARLKNVSAEELHDFIAHSLVAGPPGEVYQYNNTSSILLGWILEQKVGNPCRS